MVRKAPPPPPPPPEDDPHQPPPPPKKKKGRPSLLDLQRRALTLQQQQQQSNQDGPREAPNFPAPLRRSTRRNPVPPPPAHPTEDDDDDDDEHRGRRREKKLKLVLENGSSDRPADPQKTERPNSVTHSKVMGGAQGERSDSGPTTPLPDKKTLLFILERLQKKDKYGVYSEPVDPEELPDYHEIIEHPMDFSTVRKKLADGVYANLEQFERDVFLISSNAMRYNAPDTIYYRQARSIEELAKKSFENLRQGNEENEPEPEVKVVRRGRPPGKSSAKRPVGRPPAEPSVTDSTDATPATTTNRTSWVGSSNDSVRKGSISNMMGFMSSYPAPQVLNSSDNRFQMADHRFGRNEESSGFTQRGLSMRFGKKISVPEDNRRSTYLQPLPSTSGAEHPILSTFLGEKKQLVPIGVFIEHAYARSLARFAANLGPVGWEIAAKRIERALPPGTPFGQGWVGETEMPHLNQHQMHASSTFPNEQSVASVNPALSTTEATSKMADHQPDSSFAQIPPNCSQGSSVSSLHNSILPQKDVAQTQQNLQVPPLHKMNGFNRFYVDLFQVSTMPIQSSAEGDLRREVTMTHAQLLDMVSRTNNVGLPPAAATHFEAEKAKLGNLSCMSNSSLPFHPSSDARLLSMSGTEMGASGDRVSHLARGSCELERVNFSNSGTLNSTGSFIHPSAMGNSSSMLFGNPGPKDHGFSLHSAVGNHTAAEPLAPEDSCTANPCSTDGARKNIEPNHEPTAKPSNNMLLVNQHPERENPCNANGLHSENRLPDPAQYSFQEPSVQLPKGDSICPDLNSCIPDDRLANSRSSCRIPEV